MCLATRVDENAWLWHSRFGHVNFTALRKMGREGLVRGLPLLDQVDQLCDACLIPEPGEAPRDVAAGARTWRSLRPGHADDSKW